MPFGAPTRKIRNAVRGVIQRWGTRGMKRRLWDWEFRNGRWTCLDDTPNDPAYPYVVQYAKGGRILDLGCGPGSAGRHLDPTRYRSYVGVDISQVAIEQARRKDSRSQNSYVQADLLHYRPDDEYEVILLGDSLYYIPRVEVTGMLRRYSQCLAPGGVFLVKMHDAPSFRPLLQLIREQFDVVAQHLEPPVPRDDDPNPPVVLIAFR